jgi:PPOX class probable F420-dependent enzyme
MTADTGTSAPHPAEQRAAQRAARAPVPIPESHRDLFQKKALAHLATLMPNGSPQVTPLWVMLDAEGYVIVNSARGRQKDRNMRARPRVALSIGDPDNPQRYIQVRGRVVEVSEEGADDVISELSMKYNGRPYQFQPGQVRVTYKIRPDHVQPRG